MRSASVGFLLALFGLVSAQEITYAPTGSLTLDEVRAKQQEFAAAGLMVPRAYGGIDFFKVTYPSTGIDGKPRMLTGLLVVPKGGTKKGIVLHCHGTTWDRAMSPSRYNGKVDHDESAAATFAFATGGYAVVMPDYLGLGDDPGVHPYPYGDLNSRSAIDMLKWVRSNPHSSLFGTGQKNFVTGYSEGGAVAMWVVRNVEREGGPFAIERSAPLSGPYDLSDTTAKSLLADGLGLEDLAAKLYLSSYVAYSAATYLSGVDLKSYFAPSFATYIPFVFQQNLSDLETVKKLTIKALQLGSFSSVKRIVTRQFRDDILSENQTDPIINKLAANDCIAWAPKGPMLLSYLASDQIVPPGNSIKALATMREMGVGAGRLQAVPIVNLKLNHITATPYALTIARSFFDNGFPAPAAK